MAIPSDMPWRPIPLRISGADFARAADALRAQTGPTVRRQHVVSQVLLRRFAEPDANGGRVIRATSLQFDTSRLRGTAHCAYMNDWMPIFSQSLEKVWQTVEHRMNGVLNEVVDDQIDFDGSSAEVLRKVLALHFVRSYHMRVVVHRAALEAFSELRASAVEQNRELVAAGFRSVVGRDPVDDRELRDLVDRVIDQHGLSELELNYRIRTEDNFERVSEIIGSASIEILTPPGRREFLIGDAPVCGYRAGVKLLGPHEGLGLYGTDFFVMPLTPRHMLRIPARQESGFRQVSGKVTDESNVRQIRNAYREVFSRPSSGMESFIQRNRRAWTRRADIPQLSVR